MDTIFFLTVKVTPNAPADGIIGWYGKLLKIAIRASPEKGKGNSALLHFLAKYLRIPVSHITILSGQTGRIKRLKIIGLPPEHPFTQNENP